MDNPVKPKDRLALVVMPVVNVDRPSISLTRLRTVVKEAHGERISTEIHYLCHDFAEFMAKAPRVNGMDLHDVLLEYQHVGLPEWFFRKAAFPGVEDNATKYLRRYFPGNTPEVQKFTAAILERRAALDNFLDEMIDRYALDTARIVGFTSLFCQNGAIFALARRIKARNPGVVIVMGGSNCDSPMGEEYARNVDVVDYVFSGPAMVNFPKFVGYILDGEPEKIDALKGVFSKRLIDRAHDERAGEELDINVDCDLDYSEFFDSFEKRFAGSGAEPQVHLETSRGCWWGEKSHCTFCGLNADSMFYRAMSPDKAVKLFRDLIERYREKSSIFFAVDNIIPKNYFTEVLPRIGAPPGTKLFYEVKANLSDADVKALADAGVHWIQPGIEALSTVSLKLMKKGASAFVNLRLLKNCLRHGIDPSWNLLVGFPGESSDVYAKYVKDLPLTTHLRPPQGVAIIHFDRYSPYHFNASEFGLKLKPVDYYEYCFPFPKSSIENLAYYFVDTNFEAPHYKGIAQWVGPMRDRIKDWRTRWGLATHDSWEKVKDDPTAPRLELRRNGSSSRVFDSRGKDVAEFEVTPAHVTLLEYLETDRNDRNLREFAESHQIDLDAELAFLDERRLLFREDDRVLSLVMLGPS